MQFTLGATEKAKKNRTRLAIGDTLFSFKKGPFLEWNTVLFSLNWPFLGQ
jgi:hypothetical protein